MVSVLFSLTLKNELVSGETKEVFTSLDGNSGAK